MKIYNSIILGVILGASLAIGSFMVNLQHRILLQSNINFNRTNIIAEELGKEWEPYGFCETHKDDCIEFLVDKKQ